MEAFSWLMIVVRGPRPLWAGPTPVQEALGVVGKQDKNTLRSHAISGVLPRSLLRFLSPSSLLDVSSRWIVSVRWKKSSPFPVTFGHDLS